MIMGHNGTAGDQCFCTSNKPAGPLEGVFAFTFTGAVPDSSAFIRLTGLGPVQSGSFDHQQRQNLLQPVTVQVLTIRRLRLRSFIISAASLVTEPHI